MMSAPSDARMGSPDYKVPVNINIQQAENGWIARIESQKGTRFWVAKNITGLVALIEQLSKDFEEQAYIL